MALLLFPLGFAPPLLLPPPDPPPFVLPPDLSTVVFPPEPPEPPDPPDSLYRSSIASPSILQGKLSDLDLKLFQAYRLVASFSLMPSVGTPFASLRSITVVCSSWYQAFHVTCLEFWISPPRLSHPLVTPFEGFISVRGSSISGLFAFVWNIPSIISQFSQYKDVMMLSIFLLFLPQYEAVMPLFNLRLPLPQYEAVMPLFNLRLPLPQYEVVMISIRLELLLPHHEAGMILIKLRLPLPQYEDHLQKLWPRSLCDIVSLVWFLEKLSCFMEKTLYVLTKNNLGSWTPDLFIEKWWFSQLHTSPKLRFSSHLVGSVNWCFVAYVCVAVFQDACSLLDAASLLSSGSPRVLSHCQSLISRFSTIVVFNFSCLSVMYDSICFFHVSRLAFVSAVCLAIVAHLLYLLNSFSIVGE